MEYNDLTPLQKEIHAAACAHDELWFSAHPRCEYRTRPAMPIERPMIDGFQGYHFVEVRKLPSGELRHRDFGTWTTAPIERTQKEMAVRWKEMEVRSALRMGVR